MTTRAFRFQSDIDPATGLFSQGQIFDELLAPDPITDLITGTGRLLPAVTVTSDTHPDLFDALNAQAALVDERVSTARADYRAKVAAEIDPVVIDAEPKR